MRTRASWFLKMRKFAVELERRTFQPVVSIRRQKLFIKRKAKRDQYLFFRKEKKKKNKGKQEYCQGQKPFTSETGHFCYISFTRKYQNFQVKSSG